MVNNCIICGAELVDGKCPSVHTVKPMCLNCMYITETAENECRCVNETVLEQAKVKMMAALPEGYEVESLQIKPMLLKNPSKKCGKYLMDKMKVARNVLEAVGLGIEDIEME